MKYAAARGPPANIIIDRRSVYDQALGLKIVQIFSEAGEKTPSQYVVLSCDSKDKYSKISWDVFAITEKSLSFAKRIVLSNER